MNDQTAFAIVLTMSVIGVVTVVFTIARFFHRRLRSQEIIKAIEAGQPVPMDRPARPVLSDVRSGILLIAFAIGFGLFLGFMFDGDKASSVALIPLFLGLGFLASAWVRGRFGDDETGTPGGKHAPGRERWVAGGGGGSGTAPSEPGAG